MSTTVTVDFFSTLDGYGSAEGWPGYWGKEGPGLIEDRVRTFAQDQVLVFGATTFREFSKFIKLFDEPYCDSSLASSSDPRLAASARSRTVEQLPSQ